MISRRTVIGGLALLAAPILSGCAARRPASVGPQTATPPVEPPAAPGLDAVIDLNHNSRVSDFASVRRGNILAVIHKATEGVDWVDPLYAARRPEAESAGLLWGAYHFGTGQYPGAVQAAAFLATVQPSSTTLLALDLEPNERHPSNTMQLDQAEEFVQTVYQATGRLPLIYTHPRWANGSRYGRLGMSLTRAIGPDSILAACELWLADYRPQPEVPMAWSGRGWRLWQYAGDDVGQGGGPYGSRSRAVDGVDRCDRNLYVGDMSELYRFWGTVPSSV